MQSNLDKGKIKFDMDSMKLMSYFESVTGAKVKDLITDEKLIFVIEENDMGKAIGKSGINIKKLEFRFKKKIKLIEFSTDMVQFIKNIIYPLEVQGVEEKDGIVTVHGKDTNTRAMIIGRERQNIKQTKDITSRYFDVKEIKVV